MKVALVIDDRIDRPGGIQEYVLGLYDYLHDKGHQPFIITSGRYSIKAKAGRKIIGVGQPLEILGGDAQKSIPLVFTDKEKIAQILRREKPQIVHIQGFPGPLSFTVLSKSRAVNIMTYHVFGESLLSQFLGKTFAGMLGKINCQIMGRIAISSVASQDAQKYFPGSYSIIPIGIDPQRFKPSPKTLTRFADDKINLLFLGRLDKRKGIFYLLKAYQRLFVLQPRIRLIVVGDGPDKKAAQRFVKQKKLKHVCFVGRVSRAQLPTYFASADIYCSPATHGESFGVVLLEAMAMGLPVVAFDNPGYRSTFPRHATSFLVFNKSVTALAQALLVLITHQDLRLKIGKANLIYARRFFWPEVGHKIVKYYQSLLS